MTSRAVRVIASSLRRKRSSSAAPPAAKNATTIPASADAIHVRRTAFVTGFRGGSTTSRTTSTIVKRAAHSIAPTSAIT